MNEKCQKIIQNVTKRPNFFFELKKRVQMCFVQKNSPSKGQTGRLLAVIAVSTVPAGDGVSGVRVRIIVVGVTAHKGEEMWSECVIGNL